MKRNFPPESLLGFQIRAALSQSLRQLWPPSGKNHLIKIYPRECAETIFANIRMYKIKKKERSKLWIFSITFHRRVINKAVPVLIVQDSKNLEYFFQFFHAKDKTFFIKHFTRLIRETERGINTMIINFVIDFLSIAESRSSIYRKLRIF